MLTTVQWMTGEYYDSHIVAEMGPEPNRRLKVILRCLTQLQRCLTSSLVFSFVSNAIVIVIVISKLLKRYSKAKRTMAPAYSRARRRIKRGFQRRVKRSSGPISSVPGGIDVKKTLTPRIKNVKKRDFIKKNKKRKKTLNKKRC